jgi:hypothetical protein
MNHLTGLIAVGILCGCVNNVLGWGPLGAICFLRCASKPFGEVHEPALTGTLPHWNILRAEHYPFRFNNAGWGNARVTRSWPALPSCNQRSTKHARSLNHSAACELRALELNAACTTASMFCQLWQALSLTFASAFAHGVLRTIIFAISYHPFDPTKSVFFGRCPEKGLLLVIGLKNDTPNCAALVLARADAWVTVDWPTCICIVKHGAFQFWPVAVPLFVGVCCLT